MSGSTYPTAIQCGFGNLITGGSGVKGSWMWGYQHLWFHNWIKYFCRILRSGFFLGKMKINTFPGGVTDTSASNKNHRKTSASLFKIIQKIIWILWSGKHILDNENKYFLGWPNRYFGWKGSTEEDMRTDMVPSSAANVLPTRPANMTYHHNN